MKTLHFSIVIDADPQQVWNVLWNDASYREWTRHFNPGSYMESDWKVGGKTLFLGPDRSGMLSTITQLDEPYKVVFSHYGELNKGVEDTESERVKAYSGALESYELTARDGGTLLEVSVHTLPEFEQILNDGFVKGLDDVKKRSEQ